MRGLHVIQYPSGRFGFVGRVPAELAFASSHAGDLETAKLCGPGLARRIAEKEGRTFESMVFLSEADARTEAARLGYTVS